MEVHKHPHHVTHSKKWFEYILEFIMLFLAVYLGFVAESYREHNLDKEKVYGYMKQMVNDLKSDTNRCNNAATYNLRIRNYMDSLRDEIVLTTNNKGNINRIYYFKLKAEGSEVSFKESAFTQFKSSGTLRLINNDELSNEITTYYERWVKAAYSYESEIERATEKLNDKCNEILDLHGFDELMKKNDAFSYESFNKLEPLYQNILKSNPVLTLISNRPEDLKVLNNLVRAYENSYEDYNSFLRLNRNLATNLIKNIRKEYHLENE